MKYVLVYVFIKEVPNLNCLNKDSPKACEYTKDLHMNSQQKTSKITKNDLSQNDFSSILLVI